MLKSDNIHILSTTDFSDYTDVSELCESYITNVNEIKKEKLKYFKE